MTANTINRASLLPAIWRDHYLERLAIVSVDGAVDDRDAEQVAFRETLELMKRPPVECRCCECERRRVSDR